jgi:hypothetical protein
MPKIPVLQVRVNADKALAEFDIVIARLRASADVRMQLINSAVVQHKGGDRLLFPLIDKGTVPHIIGNKGDLLGNKAKNFGPVRGPITHPGTPPLDISPRVVTFFDSLFQERLSQAASDPDKFRIFADFQNFMTDVMTSVLDFAISITPGHYSLVKDSYAVQPGNSGEQKP